MTNAEMRRELHQLLLDRSIKYGEFTLVSGRKTDFYFDGKQITLDGRGLFLVSSLILQRCREVGVEAVGGLTLGADPIAAGVAALSGSTEQPIAAFIVRKQVKDHGTGKAIEGPVLREGARVAIVDDVITTGGSFITAIERAREHGAEVVEAVTLVDRQEGGREALAATGVELHALFLREEFPTPGKV